MSRRSCSGFTYVGLLLAVALMGAALAAIGQVWHTNVQRSREAELQFIGEQFKRAIKLYYESTPGGDKQLPKSLEDLLRDARYPVVRRYLRKVYVDPMRGKPEWGLIKHNNGDGIMGVYSLSDGTPFKNRDVAGASRDRTIYADWKFIADVTLAPITAVTAVTNVPALVAQPTPTIVPVVISDTPPPVTTPVTPRPRLPTDRCERLREMDARACTASASRRGGPDSDCESSAATRHANCVSGLPPGPLWIAQ